MKASKRQLLSLIITVAVVGCGVAFLVFGDASGSHVSTHPAEQTTAVKHETQAPLPITGEPLVATYDGLVASSKNGDATASRRLFHDVATCVSAANRETLFKRLNDDKNWIANNPGLYKKDGVVDTEARDRALASVEENLKRIEAASQLCAGTEGLDDGRLYNIALSAAQAGDSSAASCLLMAPFQGPNLTSDQAESFGRNVREAAEALIPSGDWHLVSALDFAYSGNGIPGMGAFIDQADPVKQFRYAHLMRYGFPDGSPSANQLDAEIAALATRLTQQQQVEEAAWADSAYKNHFFYSGPAIPNEPACVF